MIWVYFFTWAGMLGVEVAFNFITKNYFPSFYVPDSIEFQIFIVGYSVVLAVDYTLKKYLGKKKIDETHPSTM